MRTKWGMIGAALAGALLMPALASAEWRCDCTHVRGSCSAAVTVEGNWVSVTSSQKACSRVDYFIDGQPFVTVVVDGDDKQNWLSRTSDPDVLIQSCQVCQDQVIHGARGGPSTAIPRAAESGSAGTEPEDVSPLIRVDPVYPPSARQAGTRGHVVVAFDVSSLGTVGNLRVVESKPSGVFNRAALDAVRRWRYPSLPGGEETTRTITQRIDFAPPAASAAALAEAGGESSPGGRRGANRNWCVKQGETYDLIGVIELQLINACADPLIVYSCTEGFEGDTGRWVCSQRNSNAVALVQRGDERNGMVGEYPTEVGQMRYAYVEEQFLSRPPNTRHWWIACAISDSSCHQAAQRWRETVEGKPRSLDPRQSSEIEVAASF